MATNTNIYNVNWNKLTSWLTPQPLRLPKMLAFVISLVQAVKNVYLDFIAYRDYTNYWLSITPQVCRMEKALNDRWDIVQRRIEIVDGIDHNAIVLFLKAENKPVTFFKKSEASPLVLWTKDETAMFTADFLVLVPADVVFDLAEMTAFIIAMKLVSKTFQIIIV